MSADEVHPRPTSVERVPKEANTIALGEVAIQDGSNVPEQAVAEQVVDESHDDDEGRWDHAKAETMAAALQEKPKQFVKDADGEIVRHENGRAVLADAENGATLMDESRYKTVSGYDDDVLGDVVRPSEKQSVDEQLEALRAIANDEEADPYDRKHAQHDLEAFSKDANEKIENSLSPLATLYDLNPGKFAGMLTADFMELAKDYEEISSKVGGNERSSLSYQKVIKGYNEMLEEGNGKPESADDLAYSAKKLFSRERYFKLSDTLSEYAEEHDWPLDKELSSGIYIDGYELTKAIEEQFNKTLEGSFDKTPRQIIEEQLGILKEYQELAKRAHAEDAAEKQRIEDEAKSSPAQ